MRVLLVEDEPRLARAIERGLIEDGYVVDAASDGDHAYELALEHDFDLAVIDWRIPGRDGRTLIEDLRGRAWHVPVLMLTALSDVENRVAGLDAGADDYLTKPFAFEELLARLRAITRRSTPDRESMLSAGPLQMDPMRRCVTVRDETVNLRPKEYAILELFLRYQDRLITRSMIADGVWDRAYYVNDNLLDVTISRLRSRLADAGCDDTIRIETVRGSGYRLHVGDEDDE